MRKAIFGTAAVAIAMLASSAFASETTTYTYDELGRLISSSNSGGPRNGKAAVTSFDPAGNRVSHAVGLPSPAPSNAAIFSLSPPPSASNEGTSAVFTISKTGPSSSSLSVNYATVNGSAAAPGDFAAASGTVTFRSWETVRTVAIPLLVDANTEPAESFSLVLSSPSSGASIGTASASATINASTDGGPVSGPNNPPVTQPNAVSVGVCKTTSVNVVANDSDPDGDTVRLVSVGSSSIAELFVLSTTTISVTGYGTPGSRTTSYTVTDGRGGTATGSLTVTVVNGNGCM